MLMSSLAFPSSFFLYSAAKCTVPLDKDSSLHGMNDAAKPWLLLGPAPHDAHLPGEGRCQPITHLHGHGVCLDITKLILCIKQAPGEKKKKKSHFNNANVANENE